MKFDIILAGVGGQGVLSLSSIIASAGLDEGLFVKQSEVHGMAQRGGAVTAHLRLSDQPIESDLVPLGTASLVLSLEPLESLRYLDYLAADGAVVTATQPVANIDDYPAIDDLTAAIAGLPRAVLVDASGLARRAGLAQATNMVMAGAASALLPIRVETIERAVRARFGRKGTTVIEQNLAAFRAGQEVAACTARR
jgi:indolepyruvate ferredoxin oxidoreductase, beta subunit